MKKEAILFAVVALVVGVLVGVIFTNARKNDRNVSSAPETSAPSVNAGQQMAMLEGIVAKEPGNLNAWVQLGNAYFDANQPMKSIDAYDKALAIKPNDPNVLTDQGVMFRKVGWFDKAIHAFEQASKADPTHIQSLFNLGVVYRYDLQDFTKAQDVWERYLKINPSGPGSDQVRAELDFIKSHPAPDGNK
ncbi:tetratricopeptide repeat protein [Geopsychrobacter electrodiphilus]|uniref:tetratricopeptide repeat protein n=1 Tax=Geopsychrobacter electrodiphilus TaxID=225196 RepID=UPI0003662D58|nr:tetratricopeptide repeat protein [Geopsychrobacter electrodiphilus]